MSNSNPTPQSVLGIPTDGIANLTVDEIYNNKQAVTMVFHYYKQMQDENLGLKNERNTLQTYVSAFEKKKSDSGTAAVLLFTSNIGIGFGINLLTSEAIAAGVATMIPGVVMAGAGLYFQFVKDRK